MGRLVGLVVFLFYSKMRKTRIARVWFWDYVGERQMSRDVRNNGVALWRLLLSTSDVDLDVSGVRFSGVRFSVGCSEPFFLESRRFLYSKRRRLDLMDNL